VSPKILVVPGDVGGCGHFRMIYPGNAAIAAGANVVVAMPDTPERDQLQVTEAGHMGGFTKIMAVSKPDCDVIVMQRAMDHRQTQCIPMYQEKGIKVIVEVDDDFDTISSRNVAYKGSHPKFSPWSNREWLKESCKLADLVIVTTPSLAMRYGGHGRVQIIPNFVPEAHLAVSPKYDWEGLRVGWMGQIGTHPDDLQVMRGALSEVLRRFDARFFVVGGPLGVARAASIPEGRLETVEYAPIDRYAAEMAHMDVGIVPLADSRFNEGKSALKGLEYSAIGLPWVASPTIPYQMAHLAGLDGYLAAKPAQWTAFLSKLLGNPTLRAETGLKNKEMMRAMTIEAQVGRWIEAWESVCS
jgi:glycosyltransferase involved in cell wall biosynthesis